MTPAIIFIVSGILSCIIGMLITFNAIKNFHDSDIGKFPMSFIIGGFISFLGGISLTIGFIVLAIDYFKA